MNKLLSFVFVVVLLPITGLASPVKEPAQKLEIEIDSEAAYRMPAMRIQIEASVMHFGYYPEKSCDLNPDGKTIRVEITKELTNVLSERKTFWFVMKVFLSNGNVDVYDVYPWGADLREKSENK